MNLFCSLFLYSALEEERLDVSQPSQSHQQEGLGLRQLELSDSSLRVGGWELKNIDCSLKTDNVDRTEERDFKGAGMDVNGRPRSL